MAPPALTPTGSQPLRLSNLQVRSALTDAKRADPATFGGMSVGEFAEFQQKFGSGDVDFSAGLNDNIAKRLSSGIDALFQTTGIAGAAGKAAESVAPTFGVDPIAGRQIGEAFPRGIAEVGARVGGGPLGAILGSASAGLSAFTETDSVLAGLLGGAATATVPQFSRFGQKTASQAANRLIGGGTSGRVRGALEKVAEAAGSEAALFGQDILTQLGTGFAIQGRDFDPSSVLSNELLFANVAGNLAGLPATARDIFRPVSVNGVPFRSFTEAQRIQTKDKLESARLATERQINEDLSRAETVENLPNDEASATLDPVTRDVDEQLKARGVPEAQLPGMSVEEKVRVLTRRLNLEEVELGSKGVKPSQLETLKTVVGRFSVDRDRNIIPNESILDAPEKQPPVAKTVVNSVESALDRVTKIDSKLDDADAKLTQIERELAELSGQTADRINETLALPGAVREEPSQQAANVARASEETPTLQERPTLPIQTLSRLVDEEGVRLSEVENVGNLATDVTENGVTEPVTITFDPQSGRALLTDGNSRVAAARQAGLDQVPIEINRQSGVFPEDNPGKSVQIAEPGTEIKTTPDLVSRLATPITLPQAPLNQARFVDEILSDVGLSEAAVEQALGRSPRSGEFLETYAQIYERSPNPDVEAWLRAKQRAINDIQRLRRARMKELQQAAAKSDEDAVVRSVATKEAELVKKGEKLKLSREERTKRFNQILLTLSKEDIEQIGVLYDSLISSDVQADRIHFEIGAELFEDALIKWDIRGRTHLGKPQQAVDAISNYVKESFLRANTGKLTRRDGGAKVIQDIQGTDTTTREQILANIGEAKAPDSAELQQVIQAARTALAQATPRELAVNFERVHGRFPRNPENLAEVVQAYATLLENAAFERQKGRNVLQFGEADKNNFLAIWDNKPFLSNEVRKPGQFKNKIGLAHKQIRPLLRQHLESEGLGQRNTADRVDPTDPTTQLNVRGSRLSSAEGNQNLPNWVEAVRNLQRKNTTLDTTKKDDFQVTAHDFARNFFENQGHTAEMANVYTEMFLRITKLNPDLQGMDNTQILDLISGDSLGLAIGPGVSRPTQIAVLQDTIGLNTNLIKTFPEQTRSFWMLATLAHETFHTTIARAQTLADKDPEARRIVDRYNKMIRWSEQLGSDERLEILNNLVRAVVPAKFRDKRTLGVNEVAARDSDEFLTVYAELVGVSAANPNKAANQNRSFKELLAWSSESEQQFFRGMFRDMEEVSNALTQYYKGANNLKLADVNNKISKELFKQFDESKQSTRFKEGLVELGTKLNDPVGYFGRMNEIFLDPNIPKTVTEANEVVDFDTGVPGPNIKFSKLAREDAEETMGLSRKRTIADTSNVTSGFDKWLRPLGLFPKKFPFTRPLVSALLRSNAHANTYLKMQISKFQAHMEDGKIVASNNNTALQRVGKHKGARETISRLMLASNDLEALTPEARQLREERGQPLDRLSDQELAQGVRNLPKDLQENTLLLFNQLSEAYANSRVVFIDSMVRTAGLDVARLLHIKNLDLTIDQARQAGKDITNAIFADPDAVPARPDFLEPELFADVVDMARTTVGEIIKVQNDLNSKPFFFTENRPGEFFVVFTDADGVRNFEGAADNKALDRLRERIQRDGGTINTIKSREAAKSRFEHLDPEISERLAVTQETVFQRALKSMDEDVAREVAEHYNPSAALTQELQKMRTANFMRKRKLKPGRENIDMLAVSAEYFKAMAFSQARRYTKALSELLLRDPEIRSRPDLEVELRSFTEFATTSQGNNFSKLRSFVSTFFLGNNFSSMAVELTQGSVVLMPWLTANGASVAESGRLYTGAAKDIAQAISKAVRKKGKKQFEFDDPELQKMFEKAVNENLVAFGVFGDDIDINTDKMMHDINRNLRAVPENSTDKTAQLVQDVGFHYLKFMRSAYANVTQYNSKIAFVAGFKQGKKLGKTGDALFDFASQAVNETMFVGGPANRPGLVAKAGNLAGPMNLMLTLQNYTLGMLTTYVDGFRNSLSRANTTPAQRRAAMIGLGQMMTTQLSFAGVLGFPFVAGLLGIMNDQFPELEIERKGREGFKKFGEMFTGDEDTAARFADIAMRGFASHIAGADISARTGLGEIFGTSEYEGFNLADTLGPVPNVTGDLISGGVDILKGNFRDALDKTPPLFLRRPLQLIADEGKFFDNNGKLLLDPTRGEQIRFALGFQPKRLADRRRAQRMKSIAETAAQETLRRELHELSELVLQGQDGVVRERITNLVKENPARTFEDYVRMVADRVSDKLQPRDILETGSLDTTEERSQIASQFPGTPRVSETQKLATRQRVEESLGVFNLPQPRLQLRAQMIDDLIKENQFMTRTEAARLVDELLSSFTL